jgi:hypothetical protein
MLNEKATLVKGLTIWSSGSKLPLAAKPVVKLYLHHCRAGLAALPLKQNSWFAEVVPPACSVI